MGRLLALSVVAAASLLQNFPALPDWNLLFRICTVLAVLTLASYWAHYSGRIPVRRDCILVAAKALTLLLIFMFSLVWSAWRAEYRLSDRLSEEHENVVTRVDFRVTSMVQDQGDSLRFQARVLSIQPLGIPRDIQVVWRKRSPQTIKQIEELQSRLEQSTPDNSSNNTFENDQVLPGQVWRAALIFRRPRGALNPHGFDYEGHMLSRNIRAIARLRGVPKLLRHEPFDSLEVTIAGARQKLRSLMRRHTQDMLFGAVLIALAIGDQDSVQSEHWEIFNQTGITHLVSISGSHVTMLAAFGGTTMLWGWKRFRWRGRAAGEWIPAKVVAGICALLVAWLYCLLAGWGVPARRTFFMLLVTGLALLSRLPVSASSVLCLAAAIVTLIDPWSPTATGFWLSFGAVAVLFYVGAQVQSGHADSQSRARQCWFVIKESARLQWIITLAMLPVLAYLFQQVSLSSPFANAVAIPIVTFIVTPFALMTALIAMIPGGESIASWTAWFAHLALEWTMIPVTWLANMHWSALAVAAMPGWCLVLSVIGIAWALQPPGMPARWVGWTLMLPALTWQPERPSHGSWKILVLDVGQGGAILVKTRRHVLLFDAGPRLGSSDAGQRVIAPLLRAMGQRHLDALVVSHSDVDHAGGVPGVLKEISVAQAYSSFDLKQWLERVTTLSKSQKMRPPEQLARCQYGQRWSWDGVVFSFLHPEPEGRETLEGDEKISAKYVKKKTRTNAGSCVLHIQGLHHSALLPGDIGIKEEAAMIERTQENIQANLVVVAHHGSVTSSSQKFIHQVGALHAIAQTGYLNRFSHPAPVVEQRWREAGSYFWRTDTHGAVTALSGPQEIRVSSQSNTRKRYWHERK